MDRNQLLALKTEIETDPTILGYASKTDVEILALITAKNIPARRDVKWSTIFKYAMTEGFWQGIVAASRDSAHPAYQAALAAVELKDIFRDDVIDTGLPIFLQLSQGLVGAGLMTSLQMDTLIAMGDEIISRADQLGFVDIGIGSIQFAMGVI